MEEGVKSALLKDAEPTDEIRLPGLNDRWNEPHALQKSLDSELQHNLLQASQRETSKSAILNVVFFVLGLGTLAALAFIFKASTLAAIPLLAIAALVVCWMPFLKFRELQRVEAVFAPTGVRLGASNQKNENADLIAELQRKQALFQIKNVERQMQLLDVQDVKKEIEKHEQLKRLP